MVLCMKKELLLIRLLAKIEIEKRLVEELLLSGINWGIFIDGVFKNKVINLVLFNLKAYQLEHYIPMYVYNILVLYWKSIVLKSNSYFYYIGEASTILGDANIPYAFIKGFDLVDKLYCKKSRYIRTFNDLDILVSPCDLSKVEKLFLDQGFVYGEYNYRSDEIVPADRYDVIRMKMTSHQMYPLVKKVSYDKEGLFSGPIFVDVNFTIFDGGKKIPEIATEELLACTDVRKAFNGVEYRSLDIYYSFIQIVCHLYREADTKEALDKKGDISLRKFCDIFEYLDWAKDKWDIERLTEIIYSANLSEPFWFVLYFTDMLYESNFLPMILKRETDYTNRYKEYKLYFKDKFQL